MVRWLDGYMVNNHPTIQLSSNHQLLNHLRIKMNMKNVFFFLLLPVMFFQCKPNNGATVTQAPKPTKVELKNENGKHQLYVNDKPFWINGAGLEFGNIEKLAEHGGNSFRTWRTDNGKQTGKDVLDQAHKNGLFVTMGIDVARERHGFDYNDEGRCGRAVRAH